MNTEFYLTSANVSKAPPLGLDGYQFCAWEQYQLTVRTFYSTADRKFKSDTSTESWTVDKSSIVSAQPVNIITHQPIKYFSNEHNVANDTRQVSLRGTRNAALEKRQQDIANERAKKERVFKERQEYHRFVGFVDLHIRIISVDSFATTLFEHCQRHGLVRSFS